MTTKLVTIRLDERTIEKIDQIAEGLGRSWMAEFDLGDIKARKPTRSDVLRAAISGWLLDHEGAIADIVAGP
jgi:predicted transcriptional regulator